MRALWLAQTEEEARPLAPREPRRYRTALTPTGSTPGAVLARAALETDREHTMHVNVVSAEASPGRRSGWPPFRSTALWLIVGAYLLRLVLMPVTGQHDVLFMPWLARLVAQGHLNLYAHIYERFGHMVMQGPAVWAPYPYGFWAWTATWFRALDALGLVHLAEWDAVWSVARPARTVFLAKLAYLPFDVGIGFLLSRLVGGHDGLAAWATWAWSAAALYTPFMMGQNDVYATASVVAAVYLAARHASGHGRGLHGLLAAVVLGVGATFKAFPLLVLPAMVPFLARDLWKRGALLCLGVGMFGASVTPFAMTQPFVDGVLLNPEGMALFREQGTLSLSPFAVAYAVLMILLWGIPPTRLDGRQAWCGALGAVGLVLLLAPMPFYWLIWVTPLWALATRDRRIMVAWLVGQLAFGILILTEHQELGIALPAHLSREFATPHAMLALRLGYPVIARAAQTGVTVLRAALTASLGITIVYAVYRLAGGDEARWRRGLVAVVLPVAAMLIALAAGLYVARDLVREGDSWSHQTVVLGPDTPTVERHQRIDRPMTITGVWVRAANPGDRLASVVVSLHYEGGVIMDDVLLPLAPRAPLENRYLPLAKPVMVGAGRTLTVRLELQGDDAHLTLQVLPGDAARTEGSDAPTYALGVTRRFSTVAALRTLVVENVLQDAVLVATWLVTALCTGVAVTLLAGRGARQGGLMERVPVERAPRGML